MPYEYVLRGEASDQFKLASILNEKRTLRFFKKKPHIKLQEHFFKLSLAEIGIKSDGMRIDHQNGTCSHERLGSLAIGIVFPESLLRNIQRLNFEKKIDYYFSGVISENRDWVRQYPNSFETNYGRKPDTKYKFDKNYYSSLAQCRFGLAPVGGCPWSYRFFEAIMCRAIPVLGENDVDIYSENFVFLRHGEEHTYQKEIAIQNFEIFLKNHTLRGLGFTKKV